MAGIYSIFGKILVFWLAILQNVAALHPTDTITSAGDNTRSGYQENHNLDPNVIKSGSFNVIWSKKMLGDYNGFNEQFYAQPLVFTPDGYEQYVFVISQQNIAYRLNARTGEILVHRQLVIPFLTVPDLEGCNDIANCVGSTATGVIDPRTNTWYLTTKTYVDQAINTPQGLKNGRYFVHALDVMTLESRPNFPIPLEGIIADNAPWRVFESGKHHQRPALMQVNDYIYAGFASHCVQWNFTGWVIGWHATEGRLVTKYAMEGGHESSGIGGGIWMSGGGLSSDNPGRMFFATGNGYASQLADDPVPGRQPPTALEEAAVCMAINSDGSLTPTDFFMPWEKRDLDGMDKDLGTSGFVLLQPEVFSTSKVLRIGTVSGKTGKMYFLDLNNLGGYQMGPNRKDAVLQTIELAGPVFSSAGAYPKEGGYVYVTPVGHQTVAYKFGTNANGDPVFTQAGVTAESAAARQGVGHMTVTSMNGAPGTGILWICDVDGSNLRAYGTVPENGFLPLYGLFNNVAQSKFSRPVFGNGRVYLTTQTGYITAFGSPVNLPLNCSSPYDAGSVVIGNSSSTTITCQANIPVSVTEIGLDLDTNFILTGLPKFPYAMNANDVFNFTANFAPIAVGPLGTNINVRTNNGGGNTGFAVNTPVVIRGTARSILPILTIQPNVLSFGEVITGFDTNGKNLDFALQNDGESPLIITSYQLSLNSSTGPFFTGNTGGPFTFLDLPPVGSSIAGNTAVSTSVNFNPTIDGYFGVYLVINTNAGSQFVGAFGTAGAAPKALLEWQLANGTWITFEDGVPFEFGPVILGAQEFRKMRLTNIGGTTLTTTVSKPPVSGALAAVNALGSLAEGSQLEPNKSEEATLICSPPKSQVNKDPTLLQAIWTFNNNDPTFGKHEVNFTCAGTSVQVGPLDPQGQGYYRYLGCYKDSNPTRNLDELLYYSVNNTNGQCQTDCQNRPENFAFAGTEYEGECWCGHKTATQKVDDRFCQYLCKGNFTQYCGGDGAYLSLFADRRRVDINNPNITSSMSSISSTTTTTGIASSINLSLTSSTSTGTESSAVTGTATSSSSGVSVTSQPTERPGYIYLGCANEGTNGRALARNSIASNTLTVESCQDYCTGQGYMLSGVEYASECYCGNILENGATIGGSSACNMNCSGNRDEICGGRSALSVYNNTNYIPPQQPEVIPSVGEYISQGCYTEGTNGRALNRTATSASNMTVASCVNFCRTGGFRFAGVEYSTECYCGTSIAGTAQQATSGCDMLCGGDTMAYCGGGGRLNVYAASAISPISSTVSTSIVSSAVSASALSSTLATSTVSASAVSSTLSTSTVSTSAVSSTLSTTVSASAVSSTLSMSTVSNTMLVSPITIPMVDNYVSQGCYTEGVNGRALRAAVRVASNMTVSACVNFCKAGGYRFVGLEYSTECYCGNTIENNATIATSGCDMRCGGDINSLCGGRVRLNIYAATPNNVTSGI